jgi:Trk-type K+ transport system membrane component
MSSFAERRAYHEWPASTPILDLWRVLVRVASVVILAYALIFLAFAVADANWGLAVKYGVFVPVVAAANLGMDALIRWRRHHG